MVDRVKGASRSLELLYEAKPNGTQDSLENEDFIGLIAYGLYKIEQREWAKKTNPDQEAVDKYFDTLVDSRIKNLRDTAQQKLALYAQILREEFREELEIEIRAEIEAEVDNKITENMTNSIYGKINHEIVPKLKRSLGMDLFIGVCATFLSMILYTIFVIYGDLPSFWQIIKNRF